MPGARQNCLTAAVDNSSFSLLRLGPQGLSYLPISASSCSVSRYLENGFQNRWLGDRSITTKSLSTVGRHRSICSMQIEPYQDPWGNYTGNGGKLTACGEVIRVKYTGRAIYNCSALILTVLTRQLHVVVLESTF